MAAVLLAACGGGGSSGNGIASKSAGEIFTSAMNALAGAKSVRVSGTVTTNGQPFTMDLELVKGQGGKGRMTATGLTFDLVTLRNTAYIKGSPEFWRHFGGQAAVQLFQDKWLKAPITGRFASFAQLTNIQQILQKTSSTHGPLAKGQTSTVGGQAVIAVKDTTHGGTLYVATTGQPYPVQMSNTGTADGGKLTFDRYNEAVSLTAPKDAIDITQLHK